jgi:hypothetical protein
MGIYGYSYCSTYGTKQNINRQIKFLKELVVTKDNIHIEVIMHYEKYKINQEDKKLCNKLSDRRGINLM